MPSSNLNFPESDVVKLVLEFLNNRGLNISMLSVERETGVINGIFSDDMLFLRQLILDGQWDDVIDFIQPLASIGIDNFDTKAVQYLVLKHKFLELLCIKQEPGPMQNSEFTVDEVVKCLNSLEDLCPSKEDYSNLCLLLTLPRLSDHIEYQNWNPSNARVQCWKDIIPLVQSFLPIDKRDKRSGMGMSKSDRLMQLLIKGILYESCVDYCQHKATSTEYDCKDLKLSSVLSGTGFSDADLSLLSWLQAIPHGTFACPFEQKNLNVDIKPLEKPSLEASWSEQILVTPIKPKIFPHSAMPLTRPRSADIMSRSLNPQYDGLAQGLGHGRRDSTGTAGDMNLMSRSFAGFHLNAGNKNPMTMSVDKLFEDGEVLNTQSSLIPEDVIVTNTPGRMPPSKSPIPPASPKLTSTPMSKSKDSLRSSVTTPTHTATSPRLSVTSSLNKTPDTSDSAHDSSADLYKEYQRQKAKLQQELDDQEKKHMMYQRQLMDEESKSAECKDNRYIENHGRASSPSLKYSKVMNDTPPSKLLYY